MSDSSSPTLPLDPPPSDAPIAAEIRPEPSIPAPQALPSARLPGLTLVATPIGNLNDITARGIAVLRGADLILCEDTRVTGHLLAVHHISSRTETLHDHNEDERIPALLARLLGGAAIALVSDAGTPLMSDPGYRLVRAAIAAGVAVHAVPGPNAALMALTLSGLPPHPYVFMGFAPARQAARLASYAQLRGAESAGLTATLIWHEAPHRLGEALSDLAQVFGDRPGAVARELTKRFEEVRRGGLVELAGHYAAHAARGEITVLVGPAPEDAADEAGLDAALLGAMAAMSVRDAAAAVAAASGMPRKMVYARALALAKAQVES